MSFKVSSLVSYDNEIKMCGSGESLSFIFEAINAYRILFSQFNAYSTECIRKKKA
jgi:hypothetical protein